MHLLRSLSLTGFGRVLLRARLWIPLPQGKVSHLLLPKSWWMILNVEVWRRLQVRFALRDLEPAGAEAPLLPR